MAILIAALILSLKTDGGFTGRGVGHLSIEGQQVMTDRCAGTITHAESDRLTAAIAAAKKLTWRESYGKVHPDAVLWTLEVDDMRCGYTSTHLKLVIDRGGIIPPSDIHVLGSCVTTPPKDGPFM